MTMIVTLIGDLGGGKTSLAKLLGILELQANGDSVPAVANVEMGSGIRKYDDVHQFITIKLITKDKKYAFVIDDEAAQAGLESRGSGSKASAIESRIITHARKAHVDLVLISQLKSMLDKRAQWVEDLMIYCEAEFDDDNMTSLPNRFHYTPYDKALKEIPGADFRIETSDMAKYVWPGMDTDDIPLFDLFKRQLAGYYAIEYNDYRRFHEIMGTLDKLSPPPDEPKMRNFETTKWYREPYGQKRGEVEYYDGRYWETLNCYTILNNDGKYQTKKYHVIQREIVPDIPIPADSS